MILLLPFIALGLVVGLLRGGDLWRLAELPFRGGWLVILAFLTQVLIFSSWFEHSGFPAYIVPALYMVSLVMLLIAVMMNLALTGMQIFGLGLILNFVVITANGGFMPASPEALEAAGREERVAVMQEKGYASNSELITAETRLGFLGDNFFIDLPFLPPAVFSVGDVLIGFGAFVLVSQAMVRRRRWNWR